MEQSILTWNVPNFVTVLLMVTVGAVVFAFLSKAIASQKS